MKKLIIVLSALSAFVFASCSTMPLTQVNDTIAGPEMDFAKLNRDDYIVLGKVSGKGSIIASDSQISSERKNRLSGSRPSSNVTLKGDTLRYGYLNEEQFPVHTAEEKAVANAMYQMIELAEYNDADAVIFVTTRVTIVPEPQPNAFANVFKHESRINAVVSGLAVKIKDNGTGIKQGIREQEDLDPVGTAKARKAESDAQAKAAAAQAKEAAEKARAAAEKTRNETAAAEAEAAASAAAATIETPAAETPAVSAETAAPAKTESSVKSEAAKTPAKKN